MKAATTGASVPTAADTVLFDANSSGTTAYTVTMTGALACLDFTGSALTPTFATGTSPTLAISGSLTVAASSVWTSTGAITFNATTTGKTITTNGVTITGVITFNGVGGAWTLGSALTSGPITLTNGTFDTSSGGNYSYTGGGLQCASATTTVLNLNASTVTITGNSPSIFTGTGFTLNAGTSQINFSSAAGFGLTSSGRTFYNVAGTGSVSGSGTVCAITGANTFNNLAFAAPSSGNIVNITFAGNQTINGTLTGSGTNAASRIFYSSDVLGTTRSLTLAAGATLSNCDFRDITAVTNAITASTSGGDCGGNTNITFSSAKTVYWNLAGAQNWSATGWAASSGTAPAVANFPLAQDTAVFDNTGSVTGTITINRLWNIGNVDMSLRTSAMTLASNLSPFIYGSWINGTGTTLSGTGTFTFAGRGNTQQVTPNGISFTQSFDIQNIGGTVQLLGALTTSAATTLTNGTLDLQSYKLTTITFNSSGTNTRTIAFGTGDITITSAATGTIWFTVATGLTVSGAPVVNTTGGGATTKTINPGALSEANSISFNLQNSAGTVSFSTGGTVVKSLTLNGAFTLSNIAITIYGDLTYTASTTLTAGANAWTFGATSSKTITSSATLDFPLTFNGVAGTWVLGANLTMGSTRTLTHTNGTIDLNGKTLTVGTAYTTATGTKNLTFNAGTLVCPTAATTAFNNAVPTGYTTTAGAGTGFISMTAATAKTFVGGGSTFNCTLSQDGAGALTITGSNTFNDIRNMVQPVSVLFTAGTTTTFISSFSLSGTAGNLVTIGSVTSAAHTLSKTSGTISVSYCTISNSTATGGATWLAYTSVDGGTNTGWVFVVPTGLGLASRLTSAGILLVNGTFDENTSVSPSNFRTTSNTVYASTLDENTVLTGAAMRQYSNGTLSVANSFDEFTGAPIVDSNLMLWLDAGQSTSYSGSGVTWTDLSPTPKNYTLTAGPTFDSIAGGGSIVFNAASSQYATSATTLFNSSTFPAYTINLWVYPTSAGNLVQVDGQTIPNSSYHYSAIEISAAGVIKLGQWTGTDTVIATSTQSLNAWYNLVITYSNTLATAYINGTSVGTSATTWSAPGASTFMALMAIDSTNMGTGSYASGSIGAFMVYNRALSSDEVTINFTALRNRYGI
jgi:hypothetical protein